MAYIPTTDAALDLWADNFCGMIQTDPDRYGLMLYDAGVLANQFTIWHEALVKAWNPMTKTPVAVADKDGEKVTLLQLIRQYAAQIRANLGVSDEDKTALGLNIPDPTPTPIPVPTTYPVIGVMLAGTGEHNLVIADQLTPWKKSKPYGVVGCLLFAQNGVTPPQHMTDAPLFAVPTKADVVLDVSGYSPGTWLAYAAKWFNAKGEMGPMGPMRLFVVT